jgi:reactive intermediate/imine deaminase
MKRENINPMDMHQPPDRPFSSAVKVEAKRYLFVSGQTARDPQGNTVGIGDVSAQTRQVMENIGKILRDVGATFGNIVKITMFLSDLKDRPAALKIRSEYLGDNKPASTTVQVGLRENVLVEIEVIAALD